VRRLTLYRFQYVTLQLQGPLRRAKTASQRANALKNLPQGLNATYERSLLTIPVEERTHAIRALKWLLASLRTLKLTELAEASRIDLEADPILEEGTELDTAMSVWDMLPPGLVTLGGGEERKIHFSHSSFPEYLLSSTLQQSPSDAKVFFISQGMAVAYVLECCMAYQIHATRTRESVDELPERSSKFPLWDYAASHWMRHIESIPYDYWNVTYPRLAELAGQMLEDNPGLCLQDMVKIAAPGGDDWVEELSLVNGGTALYYVALCGHLQLLRFLLQRKDVQVNAACDRGTALTAACANGHGAIIRALLDHGADPWKGSESCCCALKAAMMSGNEEIVHSICSHPCKGELMDMCRAVDFSPLDLAIDRHSVELVRYLVVHGIAINTQGGYYGTPLQAAAFKYDCDIAEYMLQMGADVNAEGGQYGHALQAAACIGYKRIIEVLLQHKASVNARSGVFGYALHAGAMTGRVEIVKILLKSGADSNAYGGKYGYALEGSAYMGHRFTAEALINAGARINAQGGFYGNALQAAVASNERDMANFLLKSGARVQPPGPRFEAVLTRVRDLDDGEEMVAALKKFQRENWTFSLNDPAPSFMQNPENGCWQVSGAAEEDPWMEWWRNAPDNWRKSYEIIIPIGPDIRV
jgi:ankyrin repeat protein